MKRGRQQGWDRGLRGRRWGVWWGLMKMMVVMVVVVMVDRGTIVRNNRRGGREDVGRRGRSW